MNIGSAATLTELPVKTIRYYEEIGLVHPLRADNGYRDYAENDIHKLRFIQRARSFGFTVEECRQLLALYEDHSRASSDVKNIAQRKMAEVDKKIAELKQLKHVLGHLVSECQGNNRPDCPILEGLAQDKCAKDT